MHAKRHVLRKLYGSFSRKVNKRCFCHGVRKLVEGCVRVFAEAFFNAFVNFYNMFQQIAGDTPIFVHQVVDNVIHFVLYFIEFAEGRTISVRGCHGSNSHCVSAFCCISH